MRLARLESLNQFGCRKDASFRGRLSPARSKLRDKLPSSGNSQISDVHSVPASTGTSRVFDSFYDEVNTGLLFVDVVELGHKVHWLIPTSDLQLGPDMTLGHGGLGVVVTGMLSMKKLLLSSHCKIVTVTRRRTYLCLSFSMSCAFYDAVAIQTLFN